MDDAVLLDRLRGVIAGVVGAARVPSGVGAHTALAEGGLWMDSVELLQVVLASEAEFGVVFEAAEDLTAQGLETLGTLADLIRRRGAGPPPGSASVASP